MSASGEAGEITKKEKSKLVKTLKIIGGTSIAMIIGGHYTKSFPEASYLIEKGGEIAENTGYIVAGISLVVYYTYHMLKGKK